MKFRYLQTLGITSALLLTTISGAIAVPQIKAHSLKETTQLTINSNYAQLPETADVIASGNFVTVEQDHPTTGQATIIEENGQRYLEFDSDFTTAQGPAVKVVLHRSNSVPVNLQEADYITIAPLQSFDGQQRYPLPADLNLDEYQSVAIWCEQFNVTFGYADL